MSTLQLENIKHPDASGNALELGANGSITNNVYFGGNPTVGSTSPDLIGNTKVLTIGNSAEGGDGCLSLQSGWGNATYGRIFANNGTLKIGNPQSGDVMMFTANLERFKIDSAGRVTKPYHPVFRARLGSVIQNPAGQVITFTSSQLDTGGNYNTSTSRFTAPVDGKYYFGVRFYASIRSGGLRVLHNQWRVNGGFVLDATMAGGTGGDGGYSAHPTMIDTCILYLSAGDYVEFYNSSRSSTGNFDLEDGYFYGYLIG